MPVNNDDRGIANRILGLRRMLDNGDLDHTEVIKEAEDLAACARRSLLSREMAGYILFQKRYPNTCDSNVVEHSIVVDWNECAADVLRVIVEQWRPEVEHQSLVNQYATALEKMVEYHRPSWEIITTIYNMILAIDTASRLASDKGSRLYTNIDASVETVSIAYHGIIPCEGHRMMVELTPEKIYLNMSKNPGIQMYMLMWHNTLHGFKSMMEE